MRSRHLFLFPLLAMSAVLALSGTGCIFSPKEGPPDRDEPPPIPPPTSTENLIKALEIIYEDKVRNASERLIEYEKLLHPEFTFHFQPVDWDSCGCQDWGRDEEIETHRNIFQKQDASEIYSLRLDMHFNEEPNGSDSDTVFVDNVYLQLLRNPQDGWIVNGGQADFRCLRDVNGRWYIKDWYDLPRP